MPIGCSRKDTGGAGLWLVGLAKKIFAHHLYLIQVSGRSEVRGMRENLQWGAACAAQGLIFSSDLYDAVMTAVELVMGVLL